VETCARRARERSLTMRCIRDPITLDPIRGFDAELDGLIPCEIEAPSVGELMGIEFPPYVQTEVTEDSFFTGGALSRTSALELASRLKNLIPGDGG
jgi:CYTH domain-containing protein